MASKFGGSLGNDVYFYLLSLVALVSGLINSLFIVVMMPIFIEFMNKDDDLQAGNFASMVLILSLSLIIPISIFSYFYYEYFFNVLTKYNASQINDARNVLIYFGPILAITVLAEFFRVLVMATHHYTLATIGGLFPPISLIAFILFFSEFLGEEVLSLSLLFSRFVILLLMAFVVFRIEGVRLFPLKINRNLFSRFFKISTPYSLANFVSNFSIFYFDYMATGLNAGILSSISYAQRVFSLPGSILLSPILEISRIKFAKALSSGDFIFITQYQNKLSQLLLYITIPVSFLFLFFPHEIISSIFQRGSFNNQHTDIAGSCLRVYALSLPFSAIFMLNGRLIETFQKLIWPSFFGSIGQLICIGLTFMLVNRMGYIGIPLSKSIIDILFFATLGFVVLYFFDLKINFDYIGKVISVAVASSLLPIAIFMYAGSAEKMHDAAPSLQIISLLFFSFFVCYSMFVFILDRRFFKAVM